MRTIREDIGKVGVSGAVDDVVFIALDWERRLRSRDSWSSEVGTWGACETIGKVGVSGALDANVSEDTHRQGSVNLRVRGARAFN